MTDETTAASGGTATDGNDWRVTVRLQAGQAARAAEHVSAHKVEGELLRRLGGRVVVGTDGRDELFLYAHTEDAASAAQHSVSGLLASHGIKADFSVQRWHPAEEEWEATDVPMPDSASQLSAERRRLDAEENADSLQSGHAMFEVRVQLPAHHDAVALAERLQAEHYSVVRRWRFLVVGANNEDQAQEFASKIRQKAPAGAVVSTEASGPMMPFTVFSMAAGAGL